MTAEHNDFDVICEFIAQEFGLSFRGSKRPVLESRLKLRLTELAMQDYMQYYWHLRLRSQARAELRRLATAVTNGETYFFRETDQFAILAGALATGSLSPISGLVRVLSAGCSSGEEAYSIQMYLRGISGLEGAIIDAFDLDVARVEHARRGVYSERALRQLSPHCRERYFQAQAGGQFTVRNEYRQGTSFFHGNVLTPDSWASTTDQYDAVFCRNVLIYFSDAAFDRAIDVLASRIRPGGLLFLGHSESLIGRSSAFVPERFSNGVIYRRIVSAGNGRDV